MLCMIGPTNRKQQLTFVSSGIGILDHFITPFANAE